MAAIESGVEVHYIGSVPLTPVELAGLMEVVKGQSRVDRNVVARVTAASKPSCRPSSLRLRLLRGTNGGVTTGNSSATEKDTASEQILATVQHALIFQEPQKVWQFDQETKSGLGSVGRKYSPQLLKCIPEEVCTDFLEQVDLLEPVVEDEPQITAGDLNLVYMSEINLAEIERAESMFQ